MTKTDFHTQLELVINELVADRDHFMSDAEAKEKDVERLNGEVRVLKSDKSNLETRLSEQGRIYNTLETEHKNLGTSRDGYKSDAEAKATDVLRLTRERDNHRDNYAALVKCLVDNKLFVDGQVVEDLDTALAALFQEKDELQLAKITLEQEVSDLNGKYKTLAENNKLFLQEKVAAENKYITLENILVEKGIISKGTKSEDVGSSVDTYVAKVKIKDERISTLEKENSTLGERTTILSIFLANVRSIGYDDTAKKLDLFLDEVYRALPSRNDSSFAVVDPLPVSDELPPTLPLELPKCVEQPNISLNYVPSNVIEDVQPPSSSFFPNPPVCVPQPIVPSLIVSSPIVSPSIAFPNNAPSVDRSEDVTPVDNVSKHSYYKYLLNRIPSPLRSPRMLVGAAVLLLGVCYAPYSGYFDNSNKKAVVSNQSTETNKAYIQNMPVENKLNVSLEKKIVKTDTSNKESLFDINTGTGFNNLATSQNYTYGNKKPVVDQFYCPKKMIAGGNNICSVVAVDDTGIDKCMLTYTIGSNSYRIELMSNFNEKTKKTFEFNLNDYCNSQGYPCNAGLDVICSDIGGLQSDKASKEIYVDSNTKLVVETKPTEVNIPNESRKIVIRTACGSKDARIPFGIDLKDWLKYKCRKPQEREKCYSKADYTDNGVGCGSGEKFCCPSLK